MVGFWLTTGVRQRKCHLCNEKIPRGTLHLTINFPTVFRRQSRVNLCGNCVKLDRIVNCTPVGHDEVIKGTLRKHTVGKRGKIDAILGVGCEGEEIYDTKEVIWTRGQRGRLRRAS